MIERSHPTTGEIVNTDEHTEPVETQLFRTPYNYNRNATSDYTGLSCPEPTLTQQQFAEDADINVILERFGITGQMPETPIRAPIVADFVAVTDFKSAVDAVQQAEQAFLQLPAKTRERFYNDPQKLLEFVQDEGNRAEAESLGIVVPRPQPTPQAPAAAPASPSEPSA